jgi:Na+-translocating ferredoxin:NAD+ oxidoreductase subunit B
MNWRSKKLPLSDRKGTDLYDQLARLLDSMPGGFPATESGVERRILQRLFTPDEARLALSLTLLPEEPRVIARRARITVEAALALLTSMEGKGLLYGEHPAGRPPRYMAQQFVVGIWEYQVNKLNTGLIHDFEEYLPVLADPDVWRKVPQVRTIPVGEAIDSRLEVMTYEKAEQLILAHEKFAVAPCICRQEMRLTGKDCGKPLETCLSFSFGGGADFYLRNGMGRSITRDDALAIIKEADAAGLVLSPGNSRTASFICACCGCCCGVLRSWKKFEKPAQIVSSPFYAEIDKRTCQNCGLCLDRCQMDAFTQIDGQMTLNRDRCIGCGLCVTACPTHSLRLQRKPPSMQPPVPRNTVDMAFRLWRARGRLSIVQLLNMMIKSKWDRLLTR